MSDQEIFEEIKMRGLIPTLRDRCAGMRLGNPPSRNTVYQAFQSAEKTATHRLVIREARRLLIDLENQRRGTAMGYPISADSDVMLMV